jgi:hypothetical protein
MSPEQIFYTALPVIGGWVIWVSKNITTHEQVIKKLDQFMDILIAEKLNNPPPQPPSRESRRLNSSS